MNDLKNDPQFMKFAKLCVGSSVVVALAGIVLSQLDNADIGFTIFGILLIGILSILWKAS